MVRVRWEDAAEYCNWLSRKEGLTPFYVRQGDSWTAVSPPNGGYRLPTEAEWAWAARFPDGAKADGQQAWKYSWGDALPVAAKSGNYADLSAQDVLPAVLPGYSDGYASTAPIEAFAANALGIQNLGGNVAEWVHDVYTVRPALGRELERDPAGPPEGELHVVRGSSWMHSTVTELRLTFRDYSAKGATRPGFSYRSHR